MSVNQTDSASNVVPTLQDVLTAAVRVGPWVHRTPVLTSRSLDQLLGSFLFFKCENLQKVGAFKARGAANAVHSLPESVLRRGVCTHSSGNHAAALAYAASTRGIPAIVVVPSNAPTIKVDAVRGYGAHVVCCRPTLRDRETALGEVVRKHGARFVHPYDDPEVIAGQGTAALELLEQVPGLDIVVAPVGGGGLLSGCAIASKGLRPDIEVLGAEPAGADDAWRSLSQGQLVPSVDPDTIADGLLTSLSDRTFGVIRRLVAAIVRVEDTTTLAAMRLIWERTKLVVEPSAAVALGAVMADPCRFAGRRVGIVLSGGNIRLPGEC